MRLDSGVPSRRREVASQGLGAWGGALAQGLCLYALGVLCALCAYAGYATFAYLVQARARAIAPSLSRTLLSLCC